MEAPAPTGRRILAAALDWALAGVVAALGMAIATVLAGPCLGPGCEVIYGLGLAGGLGPFALAQGILVAARGQSLGRLVARIRVVRTDGTPAGPLRGALLRTGAVVAMPALLFGIGDAIWRVASADPESRLVRWFGFGGLSNLLVVVPTVASAVYLLGDAALAVLPGRRALHDRVAGTRVILVPRGDEGMP